MNNAILGIAIGKMTTIDATTVIETARFLIAVVASVAFLLLFQT